MIFLLSDVFGKFFKLSTLFHLYKLNFSPDNGYMKTNTERLTINEFTGMTLDEFGFANAGSMVESIFDNGDVESQFYADHELFTDDEKFWARWTIVALAEEFIKRHRVSYDLPEADLLHDADDLLGDIYRQHGEILVNGCATMGEAMRKL